MLRVSVFQQRWWNVSYKKVATRGKIFLCMQTLSLRSYLVNDVFSHQVKEQSRDGHDMQHMWSIVTEGFSEADINYSEK